MGIGLGVVHALLHWGCAPHARSQGSSCLKYIVKTHSTTNEKAGCEERNHDDEAYLLPTALTTFRTIHFLESEGILCVQWGLPISGGS